MADVEAHFLDESIIDHPGADGEALAAANTEHRSQLADIRAQFSESRDENRTKHAAAFTPGAEQTANGVAFAKDVRGLGKKLEVGPPPCAYAMLAFGSLAREDLTPYSDFEWAIVLDDEDVEPRGTGLQNVGYFHTLARVLYLKLIALGETILPMTGAPEFSTHMQDLSPGGLTFDGQMDQAAHVPATPMRQYRYVKAPPDVLQPTLTLPAAQGAQEVQDPSHDDGANTKLLSRTLSSYRLIRGSPRVFARFDKASRAAMTTGKRHQTMGLTKLRETEGAWKVNASSLAEHAKGDGILVKKEMYRQVDILLDGLRLYYGLFDHTAPLDTIGRLATVGDGWATVTDQLAIAHAIAVDLRWKSSLAAGSGYGLLKPDSDDDAQIRTYLAAMEPVTKHLAGFLSTRT
jgi:hypothetical protein